LRYNPKRTLRVWRGDTEDEQIKIDLAARVRYTGNPQHKRDPGDFGLTPPSSPRQNASLCDEANVRHRAEALSLLRAGIVAGLISKQTREGFPSQIWSVREDGVVFEAELENSGLGQYHGYPMPFGDPFRLVVLARFGARP
jgi:hypothetical protein